MERLINLNEYLASFTGETLDYKIDVTELNEILLNRMNNSWSKQSYVKGSDCKFILLKKYVDMFECIEIAEYIYKGEVEPSYKNSTWSDTNRAGHSNINRGELASSKTHPATGESAGKHFKNVDCLKIESKNLYHSQPRTFF